MNKNIFWCLKYKPRSYRPGVNMRMCLLLKLHDPVVVLTSLLAAQLPSPDLFILFESLIIKIILRRDFTKKKGHITYRCNLREASTLDWKNGYGNNRVHFKPTTEYSA